MFNKCYGRKGEAERCEYLKECKLATMPVDIGTDTVYTIGLYPDASCWCKRDEEPPRKATADEIRKAYLITKDEKNLEFTPEQAIEFYREHGLLKE